MYLSFLISLINYIIILVIVFFAFLGGLALTTRAGIYWVDLIDHFVPLFSLFTIGLIELICVAWWWPCKYNFSFLSLSTLCFYVYINIIELIILLYFFPPSGQFFKKFRN